MKRTNSFWFENNKNSCVIVKSPKEVDTNFEPVRLYADNMEYTDILKPYEAQINILGSCETEYFVYDDLTTIGAIGLLMPEIKKVIFNDPATIVFFEDGTKTVVKCKDGNKYDKERGFVFALLKKIYGNRYNDIMRKFVWDE